MPPSTLLQVSRRKQATATSGAPQAVLGRGTVKASATAIVNKKLREERKAQRKKELEEKRKMDEM